MASFVAVVGQMVSSIITLIISSRTGCKEGGGKEEIGVQRGREEGEFFMSTSTRVAVLKVGIFFTKS